MNILLPVLALASLATAQTAISTNLVTADNLGVRANRQTDAVRSGTDASKGLSLTATDSRSAFASSKAGLAGRGKGAVFYWKGNAQAGKSAGTIGGAPLADGAQKYGMGLKARAAMRGNLVVAFKGRGQTRASVTAGGKTVSFRPSGRGQKQVITGLSVGTSALRVSISFAGKADATASRTAVGYEGYLHVSFVQSTQSSCTVTGHARSCAKGGVLTGKAAIGTKGGQIGLSLQGGRPSALGVTFVSGNERMFQIGSTGCTFFGSAIVAGTFNTDANGDARSSISFPKRVGGSFWVQQATIVISPRGFDLGTSNSLKVSCR